jgi:hypothetical protein
MAAFTGHKGVNKGDGSNNADWHTYRCGHCGAGVSGAVVAHQSPINWLQCTGCGDGSVQDERGDVHPGLMFGPSIEDLPKGVADAYDEARRCMSVSAYMGADLICRTILMHVGVEKGAKEGKPFASYLKHLEAEGYIAPAMKSWVDLIRQHGNKAGHSLEPATRERAEGTVMFTA